MKRSGKDRGDAEIPDGNRAGQRARGCQRVSLSPHGWRRSCRVDGRKIETFKLEEAECEKVKKRFDDICADLQREELEFEHCENCSSATPPHFCTKDKQQMRTSCIGERIKAGSNSGRQTHNRGTAPAFLRRCTQPRSALRSLST